VLFLRSLYPIPEQNARPQDVIAGMEAYAGLYLTSCFSGILDSQGTFV
jgi:hypothetical protein